jgi:hypothetical protein
VVPLPQVLALVLLLVGLPASLGLWASMRRRRYVSYYAALGLGVSVALFRDLLGDAALPESPLLTFSTLALVGLLVLGMLSMILLDRLGAAARLQGLEVALIITIALAVHTLAEAMEIGGLAAEPSIPDLVAATGGVYAGLSFSLHKLLEALIVGFAFSAFYRGARFKGPFLLFVGLIVIPGLVGAALPYSLPMSSSYFFAFAAGASLYYVVRMGQASFIDPGTKPWRLSSLALLGFLLYYGAGALHSVGGASPEALLRAAF